MNKLNLPFSVCLLCLCIWAMTSVGGAQEADRTAQIRRMDQVVASYARQGTFMGTVLVAEGDRVLLSKGYGFANVEWQIPLQPDAEFHLASVSKQFTAAVVLMLQDDGTLLVTSPVSRYLPDAPKAWSDITVENLLTHTSGLKDFTDDPRFSVWSMSSQTLSEQKAFIFGYPVTFKPGSKFVYCNTNYMLLAMIVEAVSGRPFRDVVQQRIFSKLGMAHTGSDTDALLLPHRAQGYRQHAAALERVREASFSAPSSVDGGAGLYSTTGDLLLWERALFGGKVVNKASLAWMTRQGLGNYGAGIFHDERQGEAVIEHSGAMEGFTTEVCYVPGRQWTVVVLSNREHSPKGLIAGQLLDILFGVPVVVGNELSPTIPLNKLEQLAGRYAFPSNAPDEPVTLSFSDKTLFVRQGERAGRAIYEGTWGGKLRFAVPDMDTEFQMDVREQVSTMNFHWDEDALTKRSN